MADKSKFEVWLVTEEAWADDFLKAVIQIKIKELGLKKRLEIHPSVRSAVGFGHGIFFQREPSKLETIIRISKRGNLAVFCQDNDGFGAKKKAGKIEILNNRIKRVKKRLKLGSAHIVYVPKETLDACAFAWKNRAAFRSGKEIEKISKDEIKAQTYNTPKPNQRNYEAAILADLRKFSQERGSKNRLELIRTLRRLGRFRVFYDQLGEVIR